MFRANSYQIIEYRRTEDFLSLEDTWNELIERDQNAEIYQTFGWNRACVEGLREDEELSLLIVSKAGAELPVAIFPGMRSTRRIEGLSLTRTSFLGGDDYLSDYSGPIIDSSLSDIEHEEIIELVLKHWSNSQITECFNVRADSVLFKSIAGEPESFLTSLYSAWSCPIKDSPDAALRRKSLKRALNKVKRAGKIEVEHFTKAERIIPQLPEFFDLHTREWKERTDGACPFADEKNRELYVAIAENLALSDNIVFSALRDEGRLVAGHFGFLFRGKLYWYKTAYDKSYDNCSPGNALLFESCRLVSAKGGEILDFTVGNESYKKRYATDSIEMYRIFVPHRRWLRFYLALLESARKVKRVLASARRVIGGHSKDEMDQQRSNFSHSSRAEPRRC